MSHHVFFFPSNFWNHLLALAIKAFSGSLHLNNKWHHVELLEESNIALGGCADWLNRRWDDLRDSACSLEPLPVMFV